MDYVKYYSLEAYLFNDVSAAFESRGYLTSEEFFSIVFWKAERAKSRIKQKLLAHGNDLAMVVKRLTEEIHAAPSDQGRLILLLGKWHFALPMATAILTVLYADRFTVYDIRARGELGIKDFAGRKNQVERYFREYLPKVRAIKDATSLRDKDRYIWGKSRYKDLQEFLHSR